MRIRTSFIILLVFAAALPIFAENSDSPFGSQYTDTDMAARICVGGGGYGLAVFPGVEYIVAKTDFADGTMPIDIGVLAEGYIGIGTSMSFGAGVYGTGHFGLANLDIPIFEDLDVFIGIGVGYVTGTGFTIAGVSGVSYFFSPNMSAFLEYNYLASSSGCLGVQFHF